MTHPVDIHYLEIVTPEVDSLCELLATTLGAVFSAPVEVLGGARTAAQPSGGTVGVRAPMHDAEEPTTRPYYAVDDIASAVADAQQAGAEVALPPMEIPGRGQCAIVIKGGIQTGFWQV